MNKAAAYPSQNAKRMSSAHIALGVRRISDDRNVHEVN